MSIEDITFLIRSIDHREQKLSDLPGNTYVSFKTNKAFEKIRNDWGYEKPSIR